MAAPLHSGKRAGSTGRVRDQYRPMSEINVTPFVDVMLVLLVVFMITAPLLTVGVPLDLPKAKAPNIQDSQEPLVVSVDGAGKIFLQETEVKLNELVPRLANIAELKKDTRIFVRGDTAIDYGRVMQVMASIRNAGYHRIALITQLPKRGEQQ